MTRGKLALQRSQVNRDRQLAQLRGYSTAVGVFWTLIICASLYWNLTQEDNETREIAYAEARAHLDQYQVFLESAVAHGGIYIPINGKTPPRPYLDSLPDPKVLGPKGEAMMLMKPNYIVHQINKYFSKLHGIVGRITSHNPLHPENKPDAWEKTALQAFEQGQQEVKEIVEIAGKSHLRMMRPMITAAPCLACHGHQDFAVGEVQGGAGVTLPLEPLLTLARKQKRVITVWHVTLWLIGMSGLIFGNRRLAQGFSERQHAEQALSESKFFLNESQKVSHIGSYVFDTRAGKWTSSAVLDDIFGITDAFNRDVNGWSRLVHPDQRDQMLDYLQQRVLTQKEAFDREYRIVRPDDGTERWVHGLGKVECDADGQPVRMIGTIQDITERMLAKQALQESETLYRSLVESTKTTPWRLDVETGLFTYVGHQIEDLLGYEAESWRDLEVWAERIHPDDREKAVLFCGESTKLCQNHDFEYRALAADGSVVWIRDFVTVLADEKGPSELIGFMFDITERKQAEILQNAIFQIAQAAHRPVKLDELFAAIHDIVKTVMPADNFYIALLDENANLIRFPYFVDQVSPPEPARKPRKGWTEHVLMSEESQLIDAAREAELRKGQKIEPVGETPAIWLGVPLIVADKAIGVMAVQHYSDPSAYGKREERMLTFVSSQVAQAIDHKRAYENLNKMSVALEQSPVTVMITDEAGHIEYVNARFTHETGYSPEEILGKNPRILKSGETPAEEYEKMWQALVSGHEWRGEFHNKKKNGELYWESAAISPIKGPDGVTTHFLAVKENITERKIAAKEREKLEEQLRHAQKMKTIGTLAGGIAHDFNNILQAIYGYVEMSLAALTPKSQAHSDLQEVVKATQRAKEMVQQILVFSRPDGQERKPVRLHHIVNEAINLLKASIPSTITIRHNVSQACPAVIAAPGQIHQVVMNLGTNAYQAMARDGGTLTVILKMHTPEAQFLRTHNVPADREFAELTVSDTGSGMDQATKERIFEPFFTTKDIGEGTGLGLSVVHGIVASHNGHVLVESTPDMGTTFRVLLPVVHQTSKGIAEDDEVTLVGQERILYIDDEEIVTKVIKRLLGRNGYEVTSRTSSLAALETFSANPKNFDLIITDQTMPNMTGTELAKELHRIEPGMPIILISGFGADLTPRALRRRGIREVVMKPVVVNELCGIIRKVMASQKRQERTRVEKNSNH